MDKVQLVLSIIGAVCVGLPALLRAVHIILLAIPGAPGDAAVQKLLALSEQMADIVGKLFPQNKA